MMMSKFTSFPLPIGSPYRGFHSSDFLGANLGFHVSKFVLANEAVESLSSTHVDCRNQQASEV